MTNQRRWGGSHFDPVAVNPDAAVVQEALQPALADMEVGEFFAQPGFCGDFAAMVAAIRQRLLPTFHRRRLLSAAPGDRSALADPLAQADRRGRGQVAAD